jgi:protein-S-isoprenylcysteine O-methyltransferase Ste14
MRSHAAGRFARAMAWAGGAVFVASLGFFAWCYAVGFDTRTLTAPAPDTAAALVTNTLLFTVFALHHSVMARTAVKAWVARAMPTQLERSLYVWIAALLFVVTCAWWRAIPVVFYDVRWPWKGACLAAQAYGVWLTVRAAAVIDPLELAGIRQVYGTARAPTFKVVGPYHLVRHPIYLGWVLITFGAPLMNGTKLSFAIISTAYLVLAVPFEEQSLLEAFGDEYRRYQARVRWRMIPGLY